MPEVIFNGPEGRLDGRYHHNGADDSPIALILHPHPQQGGTMNNKLCFNLFNMFKDRGYSVMRFNFRGVGRSQGVYDHGIGELSDAASALDWMQTYNTNSRSTWVAGYSFGAWIGMQLLMRRPEIDGFISVAAPASDYDFTFLAPCPSSGILIHGTRDENIPVNSVTKLGDKLNSQKGIEVNMCLIEGADHYFAKQQEEVVRQASAYLDKRGA
ncbi:alpha/beta hydrolase [Thalassospira marina]|uniref:Alpha/beta hydrolase n=1 Tax=Thalassospira marina TaxID=2048283 RepID=A0A2N3KXN5_9PROT|nr:alpha/beta hydrolase [Thalassospira marina]AUG53244.1 alpha/beta hydrolase [Thalassospira marina]PKR55267.1 alpha/beta hydrolase [Thalassospira marina]